ncbi:Hypothetical predicted protein [Pelobates cultripes]|uniref:Uncharacterized protein n=1 Tax=Pelobates cultripes TaxID=61616 RepID=A0AAD1R4D9_PELCU|nr:Hypothetical predicted protein [Pelobates cultripes]CAH2223278.1 Hypothetical predicted protein [Pelobates cultripes]CAH2223279.1 Hypothetical predicted protein [Pelobates cultripes]
MEDFLLRAGALSETAETLQLNEQDADKILWPNTTTELAHTDSIRDLYNDLTKLKRRETDLDLHGIFISDYYRAKRIPRGFRVRNSPTIGRQNPEFCKKWTGIANKCSLDWMLIVVEEVRNELIFTKESINKFEVLHTSILTAATSTQYMVKLQDEITRYRNDLIRFKKQKLERVNFDYTHHQVYHWLCGERRKPNFSRYKQKVRKPQFLSIDTSSADSTSETEGMGASQNAQELLPGHSTRPPFFPQDQHTNDPPGFNTRRRRDLRDLQSPDVGRGAKNTGTRPKPSNRRT